MFLELMIAATLTANQQEIHIVHCYEGQCPQGAPATNDLIVREIYALSNNDDTRFADWVAYKVTRATIGTTRDLDRGWQSDEFLDADESVGFGEDSEDAYQGAWRAEDYNRGHQAPLAAFAGTVFWRETNIYSNITPQEQDLNQGPWMYLEGAVRDAAYAEREVWVITGPLYERPWPALPNEEVGDHTVPSGYWKVILNEAGEAAAFIMEQDTPRAADYCDHIVAISDVETRAGLSLFPSSPQLNDGALAPVLDC